MGAGYVGLTTAACLAHLGHDVTCADIDADRVARLRKCEVPILEDGLPELVAENVASKRLQFVVGASVAAREAEFVFLCVPTPLGDDGAADMSFVEAVAREIAPVLRPGAIVINKSTVPVGSTRFVRRVLSEAGAPTDGIAVASNPEFLREGHAVHDFLNPNRIVIGCDDPESAVRVSALYATVEAPMLVTDPASAEMIKYASNAFLATKISFINAIANLCELVDADVSQVAVGMGYDARIGSHFLHPGPGYGGSCFPKDTAALLQRARSVGYDFTLLEGAVSVNNEQYERMVEKVRRAAGGDLRNATVAVWGLTFKANTDDLRDSPAVTITRRLLEEGARVRAYDPVAGDKAARELPACDVCADAYEAAHGADAVVLLTEWDDFRHYDFARVRRVMRGDSFVDTRNLLDSASMRRLGFDYEGVGRR
jgi:UDPglucose 6-dehydrogenase